MMPSIDENVEQTELSFTAECKMAPDTDKMLFIF